jgi:transcriptional regulator with XRE-family HTH domain
MPEANLAIHFRSVKYSCEKLPSRQNSKVMPKWKAHGRLEPLLKREGWTQAKLAAALGVTSGAVSKWCSGDNDLGADMLTAICERVGLSADEILGLDLTGAWSTHEIARMRAALAEVKEVAALAEKPGPASKRR